MPAGFAGTAGQMQQRAQQRMALASAGPRRRSAPTACTSQVQATGRQADVLQHLAQRQAQLQGGLGRLVGQGAGHRGEEVGHLQSQLGQRRRRRQTG